MYYHVFHACFPTACINPQRAHPLNIFLLHCTSERHALDMKNCAGCERVQNDAKRETVKILKTSRRVKNAKSMAAQSLQGLPLGDACAISAAGPALLENVQGSRKVKNICSHLPSRVWPNYASENVPASRNVWSCVHRSAKPCLLHIGRFCLFFFALIFVAHAEHSRAHTEIFHRVRKQAALHLQRGLILDEALLTRSKEIWESHQKAIPSHLPRP